MARLTATYLQVGSTYPDFAQYGYNTANQRTFLTNSSTAYAQFRYDNIGQLTVADTSDNSADRGYSYDSAWNLNVLTNNGASESFLVDTRNQLTNAFSTTYGYDGNGNLISGTNGHTQYIYDDENRLSQWLWYQTSASQCTNGALSTDFFYDGLGRLRKRVEYQVIPQPPPPGIFGQGPPPCPWTQVSETHYIYDGFRVIQERDGLNNPQVSYTRGTDLSGSLEGAGGIGGLLARSSGYSGGNWTSHAYYHTDGNGNITAILDGSANLVGLYRYDPFGNIAAKTGTLADANVYRFSSKEMHLASGMYYFGFRFYDPNLQRWINRDQIQEIGGINLYGYAGNNPLNDSDPRGLTPLGSPLAAELYVGHPPPATDVTPAQGLAFMGGAIIANAAVATGAGFLADAFGGSILGWLGIAGTTATCPQTQRAIQPMLAAINEAGQVITNPNLMLPHRVFAQQVLGVTGTSLPPGTWVGTVGTINGQLVGMNSMTFFGNQLPANPQVQQALQQALQQTLH